MNAGHFVYKTAGTLIVSLCWLWLSLFELLAKLIMGLGKSPRGRKMTLQSIPAIYGDVVNSCYLHTFDFPCVSTAATLGWTLIVFYLELWPIFILSGHCDLAIAIRLNLQNSFHYILTFIQSFQYLISENWDPVRKDHVSPYSGFPRIREPIRCKVGSWLNVLTSQSNVSSMIVSKSESVSCLVVSDPLWAHGR